MVIFTYPNPECLSFSKQIIGKVVYLHYESWIECLCQSQLPDCNFDIHLPGMNICLTLQTLESHHNIDMT